MMCGLALLGPLNVSFSFYPLTQLCSISVLITPSKSQAHKLSEDVLDIHEYADIRIEKSQRLWTFKNLREKSRNRGYLSLESADKTLGIEPDGHS